nr:thiamine pyrophosphate-binding protein [Pseudooctadecabacter jejudonensis]
MRPLGAQISHMLKARGVDVIFGIPGVHNQEMYRGIEEAGITHVLARHEQGAGFMADGYARASGKPGVCYLITGPGFVNAMTALGQAYSDSVSVLAVASCLDEVAARKGQLHQMRNQEEAGRTVCDWSATAHTTRAAYALVDRAMGEFATARPRPKAIHVPIAQLEARAVDAPAAPVLGQLPQAPAASVEAAAQAIAAADKPLFIFGGGVRSGFDAIRAVLDKTGAASAVTFAGRGMVDSADPLFLGSAISRPDFADVAAEADVVVALGTELAEVDIWRDALGHTCPMIRVDIDPAVTAGLGPEDHGIVGDAGAVLQRWAAALPQGAKPSRWSADMIAKRRATWRAELAAERPGIVPLSDALRAGMPDDAMIYSDMCQLAYGAKEVWDMPRPHHWHHPSGFGTLGYALPAAIGGAVARQGQPTVCLIGDYGLQYTIAELGTAVELGLPLVILLWDNGKLGEIEDSMVRAQIAPNAVIQRNPDFLKLAEAYGAYATQPATLNDIAPALQAAFAADRPTVIRLTPECVGSGTGGAD